MSEKPESSFVRNVLGSTLMVGVYLSGAIMVVGLVEIFVNKNSNFTQANTSLQWIFANLLVFNPFAIIFFGFLVLVATPVTRVLISIFTFAFQKDVIYVAVTVTVLGILLVSFFLGNA